MNPMKKLIITSAALSLLMMTLTSTAYLSASDQETNTFTIGVNTTEVTEPVFDPDLPLLKTGDDFMKDPSVYVTEGVDCFVRVYCEFDNSMAEDYVSMNFNSTDWTTKQADGFYYYKHKLSAHESTEPLFTQVSIGESTAGYNIADFDIIVYAESCQAYNAANSSYFDNYTDAWSYWNQAKEAVT